MSQHDFDIANQGFAAFRADLNNALKALGSLSSGTAEPSTTFANQLWYETDTNVLHIRNEANSAWLDLFVIDQTTGSPSFTAGNVGVGTSSPSYNLDVQGGGAQAAVRIKNTSTGGGDPDANLYLDTGNSSGESAVYFQQGGADVGNVSFVGYDLRLISDIGGVGFYTSATNRMFVSGAGNVGIGTTSPGALLHLYGSTTAGATTILRVQNGNTDGAGILGFGDTGDSFIGGIQYDHANDSMGFFVNNSYRMTIDSAGDVTMTGNVSAANLLSGTYTPTLTAVANVASSTAYVTQYLRVGNMVTVSGHVQLTPTAANTDTQLRMTIPVASNFGTQALGGAGASISTGIFGEPVAITGDTTNDEATFRCRPTTTAGRTYAFSFTYRII